MIYFQQLLAAISLLQVPISFININGAEDAKTSLNLLSEQIESSTKLISTVIPDLWEGYVKQFEYAKQEELFDILQNFTTLLANITELGTNVTGTDECTIELKSTLPVVLSTINSTIPSSQEDIFVNLQSLANTEISKIDKQFKHLQAEYNASCGETEVNCNGTSESIIAEVQRLVPVTKRAIYDFQGETIVLAYDLILDEQVLYAYLVSHLDTGVQNITACIASKIKESTLEPPNEILQQSNGNGSILDSYNNLVNVSENARQQSLDTMLSYMANLIKPSYTNYLATLDNIFDAIFFANRTINSLHDLAPEFNLTQSCALPNFNSVIDSAMARALREYLDVGFNSLSFIYGEGLINLNVTFKEVSTIGLQVEGCSGSTTCDYLEEKLARKVIEIPSSMRGLGNSTAVLMHQTVSSVRKSGYNVIRDVMEQLGAGIVSLKACIKATLYAE